MFEERGEGGEGRGERVKSLMAILCREKKSSNKNELSELRVS